MQLHEAEQKLIFQCLAGSYAYGTNTPQSDRDLRGVFMLPVSQYLSVNAPPEQVSDETNDTTYFTLMRFLKLASDANPNVLELLFMPPDCVLKITPAWQEVIANRHLFISKRVLFTYGGYAVAQIKKARVQNKLVHNPMPEKKPVKEDFCWVIPLHTELCAEHVDRGVGIESIPCQDKCYVASGIMFHGKQMPFRPLKLECLNLSAHHAVPLEHAPNLYRLYFYGKNAKGVFRGDDSADIVCESIPIEDEYSKFAGILIYHKDAFERELKQWHQYWDWKKNRNESRWTDQESVKLDYDGKNMMHCMRLLYEGENILITGEPKVRFEGKQIQRLLDIRYGKLPYDEVISEAEERLAKLDAIREGDCGLPERADLDQISELSIRLHSLVGTTTCRLSKK